MIGFIQKVLFDMITDIGGEKALSEIKQLAQVPADKTFQINLVYPDNEWQNLLSATLKVLNITQEQAFDSYADYFCKDATKRFPTWFKTCKNSFEFLLIQPTIHNCFATGIADEKDRKAVNDKFKVEKFTNKITTHYCSVNQLCGLYKSLAKWIIHYYKDEATITERECLKLGALECIIDIQWSKLTGEH
jgi:hypothetical protein